MVWYQVAGLAFLAQLVVVGLFGMFAVWKGSGNKAAMGLLAVMVVISLMMGCGAAVGLRIVVGGG